MADPRLARMLEEHSLNAWPGLRYRVLDGWLVRFGDGYTRRANSVNPIALGTGDPERRLTSCEAAYAALGQPCVVKITPLAQPPGLDALLERRGYVREGETSVQLLEPLRGAETDTACTRGDALGEAWQGAFMRMDATPPMHRAALRAGRRRRRLRGPV